MIEAKELWIVEWTYTPADYFEETLQISKVNYELIAHNGKVEAKIDHDPQTELCDQLDKELRLRFQGVQLLSHKPYKLSCPSVSCRHADGKRSIFLKAKSDVIKISTHADITITDKNGNIVADTRAERIERKRSLSNLAAKYGNDSVAGKILQSFNNAIEDPKNCLVHLYEIKEALAKHFGSEEKAMNELGMSKSEKKEWKELRKLANLPVLRQGRHRGKMLSELRDATSDELKKAMNIAAAMVEKYLKYLDASN